MKARWEVYSFPETEVGHGMMTDVELMARWLAALVLR